MGLLLLWRAPRITSWFPWEMMERALRWLLGYLSLFLLPCFVSSSLVVSAPTSLFLFFPFFSYSPAPIFYPCFRFFLFMGIRFSFVVKFPPPSPSLSRKNSNSFNNSSPRGVFCVFFSVFFPLPLYTNYYLLLLLQIPYLMILKARGFYTDSKKIKIKETWISLLLTSPLPTPPSLGSPRQRKRKKDKR